MKRTNRLISLFLAMLMLFALSGVAFADGSNYTVSISPSVGGTASASVSSCPEGTIVLLTATPASGYKFANWTVGGAVVNDHSRASTSFTMPKGNVTVVANFVKVQNVTIAINGGGTADYTPKNPGAGDIVTITATPLDGYSFYAWSTSSPVALTSLEYFETSFVMPANDVSLTATFVVDDGSGDVSTIAPAPESNSTFSDVNTSDWFYNDVTYVYTKGLMNGTSGKLFSPKATLTRSMLVTVLYRLEGSPSVSGASGFADVPASSWYANAVTWAKNNSIVNGVSASSFAPNVSISREQIATILHRYAQYKYYDLSAGKEPNIMTYEDFSYLSSYAYDGLAWACSNGIVTGNNGRLLPQNNATRAEIAAILHRFCDKYGI